MRVVKAAAVQISPVLYSREGTVEKSVRKIHELGQPGVQFATFPEPMVPYYPYFSIVQSGYHVTVFSTGEEEALEGPNGLGGYVQFYPVNALAEAGAHVDTFTNWHPNVVVDRELITGQQPMSAEEFGKTLIAKLDSSSR